MYFNKIQCFCFEEQILNPGESVDMPVFFFIDPDVDEDPNCFNMEAVALNYTFHRVQSMEELPRPDFIFFLVGLKLISLKTIVVKWFAIIPKLRSRKNTISQATQFSFWSV